MHYEKTILVTGGAGFIGSALVRRLAGEKRHRVVNVDKLTYAGNLASLRAIEGNDGYHFERVDVCDAAHLRGLFEKYRPDGVIHLAAESHVDRSIDGPGPFIRTNILGTYGLLEAARDYWSGLEREARGAFRFLHVSTDEVFGSLGVEGAFREESSYQPNSPYSASKAGADHLVRAWFSTFGLPTMITNCSNNYGPCQFPEKLIPKTILQAVAGKEIPVYGKGENIRDWLYVEDHVRGLLTVLWKGRPGQTYNLGGDSEKTNLEVVTAICELLDEFRNPAPGVGAQAPTRHRHCGLIRFVPDRPGHDFRYAIDAGKIRRELGWKPEESFASGLRKTVTWYLENHSWCQEVLRGHDHSRRHGRPVADLAER